MKNHMHFIIIGQKANYSLGAEPEGLRQLAIKLSNGLASTRRSASVTRDKSEESIACSQQSTQSEGSKMALKSRADITRSPKQGYQWP